MTTLNTQKIKAVGCQSSKMDPTILDGVIKTWLSENPTYQEIKRTQAICYYGGYYYHCLVVVYFPNVVE